MPRLLLICLFLDCLAGISAAQQHLIRIYGQGDFPGRYDLIEHGDSNPDDHPSTQFGVVAAGEEVTRNFRIENISTEVVTLIGSQSSEPSFRAQFLPTAGRLDPGEVSDFFIRFTAPPQEVDAEMTIAYFSDAPRQDYRFALVGEGFPPQVYVDASATGKNNGSSWEDAFVNLQDALASVARNSDATIRVAEGVYFPDRGGGEVAGDRGSTFTIGYRMRVFGGFPSGGAGPASPADHPTILSGDLGGDDLDADGNGVSETADDIVGGNARSVVTLQREAWLRGFTITGGLADGIGTAAQVSGAGVNVGRFAFDVTVQDCVISGCAAARPDGGANPPSGAAVNVGGGGELVLRGCEIRGNLLSDPVADSIPGAIVTAPDCDRMVIEACRIAANSVVAESAEAAGAISLIEVESSDAGADFEITETSFTGHRLPRTTMVTARGINGFVMSGCVIADNDCDRVAAFYDCGSTRIASTLIHGNVMETLIEFDGSADQELVNLTIAGNRADSVLSLVPGSLGCAEISNCVIGTPLELPSGAIDLVRRHSLVVGFGPDAEGNLDAATDPRFRDPAGAELAPTAAGDYRLDDGSPLIEAGAADVIAGDLDVGGLPRRLDGDLDGQLTVDIGAHETDRRRRLRASNVTQRTGT